MKQLLMLGIIIVVGGTTIVLGQEVRSVSPAVQAETKARVIAELAAVSGQSKKGAPFSAEEVSESVQTLADGNRIVRNSTGRIFRNSEGRIRREHSGGTGGFMGSLYMTAPRVSIVSPAEGHKYLLDAERKTAKVLELAQAQKELVIAGSGTGRTPSAEEYAKEVTELKRKMEVEVAGQEPVIVTRSGDHTTTVLSTGDGFAYTTSVGSRYETRTEDLGTRDFEGVTAEGTRRITTIPAGAIGNDLPIETVYERWYSKELGMVVYSRNSDPRFGEQTYRLTNIVRAEPDPSLFSIPTEYKRVGEPGTVYRISSAPARPAKASATPKTVNAAHKPAKP